MEWRELVLSESRSKLNRASNDRGPVIYYGVSCNQLNTDSAGLQTRGRPEGSSYQLESRSRSTLSSVQGRP